MEDPRIPVAPAVGTGGPRKPFESLLSQTEPFLKLLSLVSIFLYGLGLLVTNIFLSKYGTSDFTLLKPHCVFTRTWTLALLLFAAGPGIAALIFLSDQERRVPARILRAVPSFVPLCYVAGFATMAVFSLCLGEVGVVSNKPLLFQFQRRVSQPNARTPLLDTAGRNIKASVEGSLCASAIQNVS